MRRTNEFHQARRRRIVWSAVGVVAGAGLVFAGWLLARRSTPRVREAVTQTGSAAGPAVPEPTPTVTVAPTLAGRPEDTPPKASPAASVPSRGSSNSPKSRNAGTNAVTNAVAPSKSERAAAVPDSGHTPPRQEARDVVAPPIVSTPSAPTVTSSSSSAPPVAKDTHLAPAPLPNVTPPSYPAADIGAVVDSYAHAIESRDMAELRRVYPTITAAQAGAFSDFFSSTRDLRAALSPRNIQVEGARATARVSGTYDFTTTTGRSEHQTVSFEAEFRREASVWRLVVVR